MKKSVITIAVAASFFALSSCGNTQKQTAKNDHSKHEDMDHADQNMMQSKALTKEQTQQVLVAYLMIKNALVDTNGEVASSSAKNLLEAIGDSQGELIKNIRFDAEHISETKKPDDQRDYFNTLSDNIYTLIKDASPIEGTIYRQHCPMAMNNQGAFWLSAEKQIKNPYFGDKMLSCGSVKEEI